MGSLIVRNNQIIGEGVEAVRTRLDVTAHAEIEAIRQACHNLHFAPLPQTFRRSYQQRRPEMRVGNLANLRAEGSRFTRIQFARDLRKVA